MPATSLYSEPDQSSPCLPSQFLKIHLNMILLPTPASSEWSLSLRFPQQNPVYTSLPIRAIYTAHHILLDFITRIIFGEEHRSLISSLCSFFQFPYFLVPLRPKYFPQYSILKHPQPTFLPQCERSSFTPINNRQDYCSVSLKLSIFG